VKIRYCFLRTLLHNNSDDIPTGPSQIIKAWTRQIRCVGFCKSNKTSMKCLWTYQFTYVSYCPLTHVRNMFCYLSNHLTHEYAAGFSFNCQVRRFVLNTFCLVFGVFPFYIMLSYFQHELITDLTFTHTSKMER
jgi:hypothetical protein